MEKDNHDVLNEHFSDIMDLEAKRAKSDRAALEYIKGLPGFKEAYPDLSAEHDEAVAELDDVEAEIADVRLEWSLRIGQGVLAGEQLTHEGKLYTVLQPHILQDDWVPGQVPALYHYEGAAPGGDEPVDEWPEWIQPTGAHDAYAKGAKVTYKGAHYISLIDANVYSPEAYPAGWQAQP